MIWRKAIDLDSHAQLIAFCTWRYGKALSWPTTRRVCRDSFCVLRLPWMWMRNQSRGSWPQRTAQTATSRQRQHTFEPGTQSLACRSWGRRISLPISASVRTLMLRLTVGVIIRWTDRTSYPSPVTIIPLPEQLSKVRSFKMGTLSPEGAASPRQGFPAW